MFGREVAAATYAVTGDLDTAALKMAWASDTTPVPAWLSAQVKHMSEGGLQILNYVWEGCQDALIVGSGNPQVRAGVLRLASALPGIAVTRGTVDGQPTLTLTAGAGELGFMHDVKANPKAAAGAPYEEAITINADTGIPLKIVGGPAGKSPASRHLRGDPGQAWPTSPPASSDRRIDQRSPARPTLAGDRPLAGGTGRLLLPRRQHRAVVIGGDQPLAVPLLENPGRVDLARVRNLRLAGEQDAGLVDGDRGAPAEKRRLSCLFQVELPLSGPSKAWAMFSRITSRLSRSEPVMMAVASAV